MESAQSVVRPHGYNRPMPRRLLLFIALTFGGIAPATLAQTQPLPPPDQLHWAVKLGLRIEQVNRAFPVVDCVVLVPDAATYLDELGKWSPRGRWPVLFEDDQLAPMFIRRFRPSRVYRRPLPRRRRCLHRPPRETASRLRLLRLLRHRTRSPRWSRRRRPSRPFSTRCRLWR